MRRLIMNRLFWIYAVCKSLLLSPEAVKELSLAIGLARKNVTNIRYVLHLWFNSYCLGIIIHAWLNGLFWMQFVYKFSYESTIQDYLGTCGVYHKYVRMVWSEFSSYIEGIKSKFSYELTLMTIIFQDYLGTREKFTMYTSFAFKKRWFVKLCYFHGLVSSIYNVYGVDFFYVSLKYM